MKILHFRNIININKKIKRLVSYTLDGSEIIFLSDYISGVGSFVGLCYYYCFPWVETWGIDIHTLQVLKKLFYLKTIFYNWNCLKSATWHC